MKTLTHKLRRRFRLTQRMFCRDFGIPLATLRHWERGNRRPTGAALILLYAIELNPHVVKNAARRALGPRSAYLPAESRRRALGPPQAHRNPRGRGRMHGYVSLA